jgi:hypothetical protein
MTMKKTFLTFTLALSALAMQSAHADNFVLPPIPDPYVSPDPGPEYNEIPENTAEAAIPGITPIVQVTPQLPPAPLMPKTDLQALTKTLFPSEYAVPAFNTIVVPLEGFLVQGIQARGRKFFKPDEVIQVQAGGRDNFYRINKYAPEFIEYFAKSKMNIKVLTGLNHDLAAGIMASLFVPALGMPLDKVATAIETRGPISDLQSIATVRKTLMITFPGMNVQPADQTLNSGPIYYSFTDYDSANRYRSNDPRDATYFPPNEKEWYLESNKVARMLFILSQANRQDKATYNQRLGSLSHVPTRDLTDFGIEFVEGNWQRLQFVPQEDPNTQELLGCQVVDRLTDKVVQKTALSDCQ